MDLIIRSLTSSPHEILVETTGVRGFRQSRKLYGWTNRLLRLSNQKPRFAPKINQVYP
jgi:hypothetical protein